MQHFSYLCVCISQPREADETLPIIYFLLFLAFHANDLSQSRPMVNCFGEIGCDNSWTQFSDLVMKNVAKHSRRTVQKGAIHRRHTERTRLEFFHATWLSISSFNSLFFYLRCDINLDFLLQYSEINNVFRSFGSVFIRE